jgi:poly-gamma-glutamate capsule biosynthesis protein CapA/YwtB (metallophosphatase superfamily)
VIVAVHAGDEYRTAPNATRSALAQAALDAGADAYIGGTRTSCSPSSCGTAS